MENTANLGLFAVYLPNYLRIRGKNLCVHGEDTQQNIKDKQHIKIGNILFLEVGNYHL